MFGTDLSREYELASSLGVSAREAFEAGLAGALCGSEEKRELASLAATVGLGRVSG